VPTNFVVELTIVWQFFARIFLNQSRFRVLRDI
jgi:hypothetical protein